MRMTSICRCVFTRGRIAVVCSGSLCMLFLKQKTAFEMRISCWGSDVCSSDLLYGRGDRPRAAAWHRDSGELQTAGAGPELPRIVVALAHHAVRPVQVLRVQSGHERAAADRRSADADSLARCRRLLPDLLRYGWLAGHQRDLGSLRAVVAHGRQ